MDSPINKEVIIELGNLDSRIAELLHMIEYIPEDIQNYNDEINNQSQILKKFSHRKHVLQEKLDECNKFVALEQARADKADAIMSIAQNQQSYLAAKRHKGMSTKALRQIAILKEHHTSLLEKIDSSIEELNTKIEELEAQLQLGKKSVSLGKEHLKTELKELREKEKDLRNNVDPEFLSKMDHLSSCGSQPIVVTTESSKCTACLMTFPDKIFQEMLRGDIRFCPNCMRIMLTVAPLEETTEAEASAPIE